eukprot:4747468-Lingulodinium_polyedra.AAC.1
MDRCSPRAMIVKGKLCAPRAMMTVMSVLFWTVNDSPVPKNSHGPVSEPFGGHRESASEVDVFSQGCCP